MFRTASRRLLLACRNVKHQQHQTRFARTLVTKPSHNTEETRPRRSPMFIPFFTPPEPELDPAHRYYPRKTAKDVASLKTPPTCTKMLTRDFIDDSLYNPNYGYFSKQAVIFSPETDFDFTELRDHMEFLDILARMYKEIESEADEVDEVARQVWHTPTELFKVYS